MAKPKKSECESMVRHLIHEWKDIRGLNGTADESPSFLDFKSWACSKGYEWCFKFRSVAGPDFDAEMWFDQELKQMGKR